MRRVWAAGATVVAAFALAACGGGGDATDAGLDGAADEVFDTRADGCTEAVAEVRAEVGVAEPGETADVASTPWMPEAPVEAALIALELTSSEGIAVDGQGRFLLTANDALMRLAPGGALEKLTDIPPAPGQTVVGCAGVAWHPAWGAVLAQTQGSRLHRWTEAGGLVQIADPIGGGPNGVLFDGQGRCLVSLSTDGAVVRLDTPDAAPVTIAAGIAFANGLALAPDGTALYVASTTGGAVFRAELSGEPPYTVTRLSNDPLLSGADGLLMSPDGWLLVASWGKGRIVGLHPDTLEARVVSDQPAGNLKFVASLAFGPGGDLDPACLFATRLHQPGLVKVCPPAR